VVPSGQPVTGVWAGLIDELDAGGHQSMLVAADYDPGLRYLNMAAFATGPPSG
jgi:hypothetical protein